MAMATVIDPSMMKSHSQAGLLAAPSILAVTVVGLCEQIGSMNEWCFGRIIDKRMEHTYFQLR